MKIKKLAIIILMTTFFIILGTKAYATTGTINSKTVNLKKAPDSKTVLEYLNKDDEVEILEHENGWYKVKAQTELGKVTGYVSEEFVDTVDDTLVDDNPVEEPKETEPKENENNEVPSTSTSTSTNIEEDKQYALSQEVSVKFLPLINSREKSKMTGNITVIEIINDWVKIENDTENGWIRKNILKDLLTNVETTEPEQSEEPKTEPEATEETENSKEEVKEATTTELNKVGYVSADGLRVRKEPTTDSEEIDSLSRNNKVNIIGQTGNWYKIDLDGKTGYVSAKYISDTKLTETTSRSGSTLKNQETVSTTGAEIVEYAKQYLGYKYVSGGTTPSSGFDCSGFTQYVYNHFGINLSRTSGGQNKNGTAVEQSDLQLGDLVIFNNDANTAIGHVGIYVGDGNFIHASNPSDGVKITTLTTGYYQKRYVGARRVI